MELDISEKERQDLLKLLEQAGSEKQKLYMRKSQLHLCQTEKGIFCDHGDHDQRKHARF